MIQFIKNSINDIRRAHECDVYYDQCFTGGDQSTNEDDNPKCYKIIFDNQQVMIDSNILENRPRWKGRFENSKEFENWLEENLRGYYNVRGWGNGRGNVNQVKDGIWRLEVICMRQEDALAVKMRWKW